MNISDPLELTRDMTPFTVRLACAGVQRAQGEAVLDLIQGLHARGGLRDGMHLRVAGFDLRLRPGARGPVPGAGSAQPGGLTLLDVCEPDFGGDPTREWRNDVSTTLAWVGSQVALANRLGVPGEEVRLHQMVVLSKSALASSQLEATRNKPLDENDSGWCLTDAAQSRDPDDPDAYGAANVMTVLRHCPELGAVLALPPGCAAMFEQHRLVALFDAQGDLCWSEP